MTTTSILNKLPKPIQLTYNYDFTALYYKLKEKPADFNRIPEILVMSPAVDEKIKRAAPFVIQSPGTQGVRKFHTRMERVLTYENIFFGDDQYKQENKNLILFILSPSKKRLIIHYFKGYYPPTKTEKRKVMRAYSDYLEKL